MRNSISINQRVKNVLIQNLEEDGGFLSLSEITRFAYGDAYIKETKKTLTGKVKRAMLQVIKDLENAGLIVMKDREVTLSGKKLTHNRILGYKIFAGSEGDRGHLDMHRLNNAERFKIAQETIRDFDVAAFKAGLIEERDIKRISF